MVGWFVVWMLAIDPDEEDYSSRLEHGIHT
jgi:hypothetical protein